MPPRLFVDLQLAEGASMDLPPGPARHVQVLRLQPGAPLTLFDGRGGEWSATVARMGRSAVGVEVGAWRDADRELGIAVTLALGVPANERMDTLVEKATELGAAWIQPLVCERSVLRLVGERASKKVAHWQAVAVAAAEQSGRTRPTRLAPIAALRDWLAGLPSHRAAASDRRWMLSLRSGATPLPTADSAATALVLSGPEGGLSESEEAAAAEHGFDGASLGPRILRADTAPLAALVRIAGWADASP